MGKEQLGELINKSENISTKNEYSKAVLMSIHSIFDGIIDCTNEKEDKKDWTFYEVERVAERTEILLNLLSDLLKDSSSFNDELAIQLMLLKDEEM
ncbi:hypothetical protein [Carnobacterium mobile]|uniref:hypothetical protein n=1 Tax=Carnobacterium mobile TaxID=2750 RepID=UPI0005598634|nr:hypothetical protein [Carnobacterium mobile]